jgi:hypothetical protein
MLLWPRFKQAFDSNLKSLRAAVPKKLVAVELTPHIVSRYSSLASPHTMEDV